jgi:hypothetical protein
MTRFVVHFDTARDYTLLVTITHTLVSTVTPSLSLLGSFFQRRTFPFSGFPNYPRPQLSVSHSNSSQRLNPRGSLTNSPTNQLFTNCTNSSWLQHLGTDRVENTALLLQWNCCVRICWRNCYLGTAIE